MDELLWDIIARTIQKENVSIEEKQVLEEWKNESLDNYKIFIRLSKSLSLLEETKLTHDINIEETFYKTFKKINHSKNDRLKKIYSYIGYVASFVFIIITSLYFLNNEFIKNQNKITKSDIEINIGSKKAILYLENGKILRLDSIYNNNIVEEKGGTIITNERSILKYSQLVSGDIKKEYNSIVIPRGGEYQLELSDGTKVWLNSETTLKFPIAFMGEERKVYLEGEAFFKVAKDKKHPFIVETGNIQTKVLGTSFNISSYANIISTTLVEGSVIIKDKSNRILKLEPGEQSVFDNNKNSIYKKRVNVELFTSWKDGNYSFENESLDNILTRISRWYDVHIFYENSDAKFLRFSGKIMRYENITDFLEMIEMTKDVEFKINGKTIVVKKK